MLFHTPKSDVPISRRQPEISEAAISRRQPETTTKSITINNSGRKSPTVSSPIDEHLHTQLPGQPPPQGSAQTLFNCMTEKLNVNTKKASQSSSKPLIPSIYKVPMELRMLKESAYAPHVVSIGPIHSNNERLKAMEHIKMSYTNILFFRKGGADHMSETLQQCVSAMVDMEDSAQNCYAENVKPITENEHRLAEMMVFDGCFILELLYRCYNVKSGLEKTRPDDPVFGNPMRLLAIRHDLVLLENQIPFFVLETLFSLTVECIPNRYHNLSLTNYVLSFFGNILSFGKDTLKKKTVTTEYHILNLLHKCYYLPSHEYDPLEWEEYTRFPYSASDLDWAGVKFVADTREDDLFSVNFIKAPGLLRWFCGPRFEIPPLAIYDSTESFLRNLIAFEQCCPVVPRHITSYAIFMDSLINTPKDVELLEKAGVIQNYLGTSEEASQLFNNICKHVVLENFFFKKSCNDAREHCQHTWPRFLTSLKRDYFANPWSGIAVLAAFIIFGVTVVQTIYTVLSYY